MPIYVRRNIKNKWVTIEVSDEEIEKLKEHNLQHNLKMLDYVIKNTQDYFANNPLIGSSDSFISILVDRLTTPLHYMIENYVDHKLNQNEKVEEIL